MGTTSGRLKALSVALALWAGCLPDTSGFGKGEEATDGGAPPDAPAIDSGSAGQCSGDPECVRPPSTCHERQGTCEERRCVYGVRVGDRCDDASACTAEDRCEPGGVCRGTPCPAAPPRCDGDDLVTATGRCEADACVLDESRSPCEGGCTAGACRPPLCVPSDFALTDVPTATAAFDADVRYVADEVGGDHLVYVDGEEIRYLFRARGGSWTDERLVATELGRSPDRPNLALDPLGAAHFVYETWLGELIYLAPNGTDWTPTPLGDGGDAAMAILPSGDVHVVYSTTGGMRHGQLANGATEWEFASIRRTTDGFTRSADSDATRMYATAAGGLRMLFHDFSEDEITYGQWDGTSWSLSTAFEGRVLPGAWNGTLDGADFPHLCISPDDTGVLLHVAGAGPSGWVTTVVDDFGLRDDSCAIAVNPGGDIYIAYREQQTFAVRYSRHLAGTIGFDQDALDASNGFPFGAHADGEGRVRFLYRTVGDTFRVAEARRCP